MARVLITGAGGFTGGHMATELRAHGYEVAGLFSHSGEATHPGFDAAYCANLLHVDALQQAVGCARPEYVIHLAGQSFVAHGDAENIYRTNVVGSRNLMEVLSRLASPPAMTLLASSASVYGNAAVEVLDELTPAAPANDYGVSKLAMEYVARLYSDRIRIVVVRPFNYTGTGQSVKFLIPKIVDHARRRTSEIELGNLDVARDFSDVRFVVKAYRRLIESPPAAGQTVNVCSGKAYSLREVIELVQQISSHQLSVRVNPAFVRSNEVRSLRGKRSLLEAIVGPLESIPLRSTLEWMLEQAEVAVR